MSAIAIARPGAVQRSAEMENRSQQDIANLAYALWQRRGSASGSAEEDRLEAERQLSADSEKGLNPR